MSKKNSIGWYLVETNSGCYITTRGSHLPGPCIRSVMYDTLTELILEEGVQINPCRVCGGIVKRAKLNSPLYPFVFSIKGNERFFETESICYSCFFFSCLFSPEEYLISGATIYKDRGGTKKPSIYNGFCGRLFSIKRLDTGETFQTNNLFHVGEIPHSFRDAIKSNCIFLGD